MIFRLSLTFVALMFANAAALQRASAQGSPRTWVASNGDDTSGNGSRAAPYRRFDTAYNATDTNGEINCVDSAGYGGLTITRSITINCLNADGNASPSISSPAQFTVAIGPNDKVTLRGLDFGLPLGPTSFAIRMVGAGTLILNKVKVSNAVGTNTPASGLLFTPTGAAKLIVTDSLFVNNGSSSGAGIRIFPTSAGTAQVMIKNTNFSGNAFGIAIDGSNSTGGINATIVDSVMAGNAQDGIVATSASNTAPAGVTVIHSQSLNNAYGIRSIGSNITVRVEGSKIIGNGTGLSGGGALLSGGGNTVQGNATNGGFTGSYALQ